MKANPDASLQVRLSACLVAMSFGMPASGEWQLIDNFAGGVLSPDWQTTAAIDLDPSYGYLSVKILPDDNSTITASARIPLPKAYSSGKFTVSFDLYLPNGPASLEHQFAFGAGSRTQAEKGSWNASGSRNRFQTIGPAPQKLGNAYDLGLPEDPDYGTAKPDVLGTTERGAVYNIWLVYDLNPESKGVTIHSRKANQSIQGGVASFYFPFDDAADDDWSPVEYFCISQGWMSSDPDGDGPLNKRDSLGALIDSIHVSDGENLTLNPDSFSGSWEKIDSFSGGAPEADWSVDAGVSLAIEGGAALVTGTVSNGGAHAPLAFPIGRGSTTVTLQALFPSGAAGNLNWAQFAVVSDGQLALTGSARFGGNDRLITYGTSAPQGLTKWTAWTTHPDLLGGTRLDTWYQLWLVYDNDGKTLSVFGAEIPESGDAVAPAVPAATFTLQTAYAEFTHIIFGAALANYGGMKVDNIHQAFGTNLTVPRPGGAEPGLKPGEWNFTEVSWVYGYTPSWGYSLFMGFIYIADLPWIYTANRGWTFLSGSFPLSPSGLGFHMYNLSDGWIYTQDNYGGFYWLIGTTNPPVWHNFLTAAELSRSP